MKVIAVKDFDFYVLPKVIKFKKGQVLETPQYSEQVLSFMLKLNYVKEGDSLNEEIIMENKILNKDFKKNHFENKITKKSNKDKSKDLAKEILEKHGLVNNQEE